MTNAKDTEDYATNEDGWEIEASVELWDENRQSNGKNMWEPCMNASTSPQRISELEEILKSFCLPNCPFKKH